MTRKRYQPKGKMLTSPAMALMRHIAFSDAKGTPAAEARRMISLQDRLYDDDSAEAAAEAKRQRKAAKRMGLAP